MEAEKSGKVKLTVELELNQALLELIKANVDSWSQAAAQGMNMWRDRMGRGGKGGHGMGMMMHHGEE